MPRQLLLKIASALTALLAVLALLPARHALAIDSLWNVNAAGNWSTTGNWTAGVPNAIGDIARLTYNITAARTVTINTSSRTVGSLYLNDDNYGYTLAGLALKLDVSSGSALIQSDGGTGVTHTISAPVTLNDSTTIAVNSATLQISGVISSGAGITKTGAGTLTFTAANTYAGGTTISAGTLRLGINNALPGAKNVTLQGGGMLDIGTYNSSPGTITLIDGTITGTTGILSGSSYDVRKGTISANLGGSGGLTKTTADTVTLAGANTYGGDTTVSGGTLTVSGTSASISNTSSVYVSGGTLMVTNGGLVTAGTLYASPSNILGNGTITATQGAVLDSDLVFDATHGTTQTLAFGTGGTLNLSVTSSGNLGAGYKGNGTLRIADGVTVTSGKAYFGYNSGSVGTATVTGTGSNWTNSSSVYVGYSGGGTLNVQAGGQGSSTDCYMGYNSGSSGTAAVAGTGSTWTNRRELHVGYYGSGTLSVQAGGQLVGTSNFLGTMSGSTGTATVTGTGSKWTNSADIYVGFHGSGTLRVESGGQVSSSGGYIALSSVSTCTATVTGTGSKWTMSSGLSVGWSGTGTLTVADGGLVTAGTLSASPSDLLGNGTISVQGAVLDADLVFDASHGATQTLAFGTGGTLIVSPTSSGELGAGFRGSGTLRIADGVSVTSATGMIGLKGGSTGTATVTGTGSKWTNNGELNVGSNGIGTLNVQAGGQLTSNYTYLGYWSGSTGTATVTGTGSKWTNSNELDVSYYGSGTLNVQAGGQFSNTNAYLGYNSGSTGMVTVVGSGSVWNNTGSLYVGGSSSAAGGKGSVTVTSGGNVTVAGTMKLWKADSAVTVNGGTMTAGTLSGTTGTIRITDPVGSAALTVGSAASDTFSGSIVNDTGPGSLTKVGSGAQTLGGVNTFTGVTTISGGTLSLSGVSGAIGNSTAITVNGGGTLKLDNTSTANNGNRLADALVLTMNGGTLNFSNNSGTSNYSETIGQLNLSSGASTVMTSQAASGQTSTLTFSTNPGIGRSAGATVDFTGTGLGTDSRNRIVFTTAPTLDDGIIGGWAISGNDFAKYITSPVTSVAPLASGDYYTGASSSWASTHNVKLTGGTTTTSGTTVINSLNIAQTSAATVSLGSGTLRVESGGILISGAYSALIQSGTLTAGTGTAAGELIIHQNSANDATISAVIANNGGSAVSLIKAGTGAGRLILSGANTYTGATAINAGILQANHATALGNGGNITFGGGTLQFSAASAGQDWGARIKSSTAAVALDTNGQNVTFGGAINNTNTAGLTKAGSGTLTLGGANTYTGATTVSAGTLLLGAVNALPSGSSVSVQGASTLNIGAYSTSAGTVSLIDGTIAGTTGVLTGSAYDIRKGTVSAKLGGSGGLTKTTAGTVTMSAANTYTGATTVSAGTLLLGAANALPSGSSVSVQGASTLSIGAYSTSAENITLIDGTIAGTTGVLTGSAYYVRKGTVSAKLGGSAGLTKTTGSTVTMSAANTYSGPTTISGGTLKLASGAAMASTVFDVGSGATFDVREFSAGGGFTLTPGTTLKGGGTVLGDLVVGGVVAPGESPGILTVGNMTFNSTGALQIELGGLARGTEYDVLAASGTITLQSGSTLAVTLINGFVPQGGDEFDILDFAGVSGAFNAPNLPALGDGLSWDTSNLYTSGTILVAPEPATLALVVAGAVATMLRRKR